MAGEAIEQRSEIVDRACDHAVGSSFIPFRDGYAELPVGELPLDLPLYRVDNGRLTVRKADYIRRNRLPSDYFERGEDASGVQDVLHEMLLPLAQDKRGAIFDELRRAGVQTEPILVTRDGVTVNGNRRLAAMRALYRDDPQRYSGFSRVRAAVLPADATVADLEETEARLQMAPETKLAYGWIDRRLKLRHQRDDLGLPPERISQAYGLDGVRELERELAELALAEDYLDSYLGTPLGYDAVADRETFFAGLCAQIESLRGAERTVWTLAGYAMIKEAAALDILHERYFPFVAAKPPYIKARVLVAFGNEAELWPDSAERDSVHQLSEDDYLALSRALEDGRQSHANAKLLKQCYDSVLAELQAEGRPKAAFKHLEQTIKILEKADPAQFDRKQMRRLRTSLAQVTALVDAVSAEREAAGSRSATSADGSRQVTLGYARTSPLMRVWRKLARRLAR